MKLYAVLCWWDESPTWLAGCVASLARIGVDHVVAVDGRFPHFAPGSPAASPIEQSEAILVTAASAGMGVTIHRPTVAELMETGKRELCHQLVSCVGVPMRDWFVVIDGDEYVDEGRPIHADLVGVPADTHCVAFRVANVIDPEEEPGPDNGVNERTAEIHRKLPVDTRFVAMQSRVWRVMHDPRVGPAHYQYTGRDDDGTVWYLRPDIGTLRESGTNDTRIEQVRDVTIMHRRTRRTFLRRTAKKAYYDLRDEIGLERA